jgi:hypothetical protein
VSAHKTDEWSAQSEKTQSKKQKHLLDTIANVKKSLTDNFLKVKLKRTSSHQKKPKTLAFKSCINKKSSDAPLSPKTSQAPCIEEMQINTKTDENCNSVDEELKKVENLADDLGPKETPLDLTVKK